MGRMYLQITSKKADIPKYIKYSYNSTMKNCPIKKMSKTLIHTFLEKTFQEGSRHMEKCSSLITKEIQVKLTMSYHLTPVRIVIPKRVKATKVGKDMEKKEYSPTVRRNLSWCCFYGKHDNSLKKKRKKYHMIQLSIYKTQKDLCTPMFIAAPSAIVKSWSQLKCPTTDEWIKKCGICTQ